jgi:hypothetical protein
LDLGNPTTVQASSSTAIEPAPEDKRFHARKVEHPETFPLSSIVTWDFPARGDLPPVRMSWYEGWLKPPRPAGCEPDLKLPDAGVFFIGDKGVLFSGFFGGPRLIPENQAFTPPPKTLPRTVGHYVEWIQAAKGGPAAHCNFEFGSLLTEVALLGVAATRTGRQLSWDAGAMQFRNDPEANALINPPYRAGWSL